MADIAKGDIREQVVRGEQWRAGSDSVAVEGRY